MLIPKNNSPKLNAIAWLQRHGAYGHHGYNYTGNKRDNVPGWPKVDLAPTDASMDEINQLLDWGDAIGWRNALTFGQAGYPSLVAGNKNTYGFHPGNGPYLTLDFFTDLGNFIIRLRKVDSALQFSISGGQAFQIFRRRCIERGIALDEMAISNGYLVKDEIKAPMIDVDTNLVDIAIEHANHIDFHSAYPGGLIETHKEFKPVVRELYKSRKQDETAKAVLNLSVGFFQSKWCIGLVNGERVSYAHADLARDAINRAREKLEDVTRRIQLSGGIVLAHNTDGVWYAGDVYHGEGEGDDVGQWGNDHIDCTIRFRSKGAYEFIEDGKYHAVVRGRTAYDRSKPRDQWEWGDIYRTDGVVAYTWSNGRVRSVLEALEPEGVKNGR